ncbi:hypothetical protein TPY_3568 [Sulfobacillus acidophilus TPY]|nr:hypothetical protein TPY_3568 [Sulfobacillus acidophilus TPY]
MLNPGGTDDRSMGIGVVSTVRSIIHVHSPRFLKIATPFVQ